MNNIVTDGIINEELWEKARIKVLFILKEPYGQLEIKDENENVTRFNLCKWVEKTSSFGRGGHTWQPIIRILKNIKNINNIVVDREYLNASAIINCINVIESDAIEYSKWHKRTPNERLWGFYTEERNFRLKEQISKISPDVIICGGTYDVLADKNLELRNLNIEKFNAKKIINENSVFNNVVISNISHPSDTHIKGFTSMEDRDKKIAENIFRELNSK